MSKEWGEKKVLSKTRISKSFLEMTKGLYSYSKCKNSINRRKLKLRRKKNELDQKRKILSIWKQQTFRNQEHYRQENANLKQNSDFKEFSFDICCTEAMYQDKSMADETFNCSFTHQNKLKGNSFFEMNKQIYQPTTPFLNPNG